MGAIPHLFEILFLIIWGNNRDCHITMPLSMKTMEVQIKGDSEIRGLERCRSTARGRLIKCQGWRGGGEENWRVNCVTGEDGFHHWL